MIPSGSVRLDGERGRDAEREHQQHCDDGTTSHPETSSWLKIPSWTPTGNQFGTRLDLSDKGSFKGRLTFRSEQEVKVAAQVSTPLVPTSPTPERIFGSGLFLVPIE